MDAFQIRNLCIDSDKFLKKQLFDLKIIKVENATAFTPDEFILVEQSNEQNITEAFTKTENDYEEYTNYEILDADEDYFQMEPEQDEKHTRTRARSKTKKTFDTTNVILSKKYKLIDPKMFETVQSCTLDKIKRQPMVRQACPVCGLMFRSNYIDKHIETHDESSGKYECDFCGKKFKVKNYVS